MKGDLVKGNTESNSIDEGQMSVNIQDLLEENITENKVGFSNIVAESDKEEFKTNITNRNVKNIDNIDNIDNIVNTGLKKSVDMTILDDDEIIIDDDEIIESKKEKEKVKESGKLVINNIEEINLDLDEISDLEELTLSKLQNTTKPSSFSQNPVKKDDTKYIFFNDA